MNRMYKSCIQSPLPPWSLFLRLFGVLNFSAAVVTRALFLLRDGIEMGDVGFYSSHNLFLPSPHQRTIQYLMAETYENLRSKHTYPSVRVRY
jgi:hypothetical protein